MRKKAFSLIEVLVASVIFMVSVAGILSSVRSVSNKSVIQSTMEDVKGVLYGQKFLDSLRQEVSSSQWDAGSLVPGTYPVPADAGFPGYTGTYTVTELGGVREIVLTICDPSGCV